VVRSWELGLPWRCRATRHVSRHLFFRWPSNLFRFLETCQQFDVAWRVVTTGCGSAGCPVRRGKLRPFRLKLPKCLLLVDYTFLQRLLIREAGRSSVVEAAARAISNLGALSDTITTKCDPRITIGTEISIVALLYKAASPLLEGAITSRISVHVVAFPALQCGPLSATPDHCGPRSTKTQARAKARSAASHLKSPSVP